MTAIFDSWLAGGERARLENLADDKRARQQRLDQQNQQLFDLKKQGLKQSNQQQLTASQGKKFAGLASRFYSLNQEGDFKGAQAVSEEMGGLHSSFKDPHSQYSELIASGDFKGARAMSSRLYNMLVETGGIKPSGMSERERRSLELAEKGTMQIRETPTGFATFNATTGEFKEIPLNSVQNATARKITQKKHQEDLKNSKSKFDTADKIIKRYDKLSDSFYKTREAYDRIGASQDTAAGDIAMIFNYMKMLDPGSVVREGEFATAQNAGSVGDRVWNSYNRLLTGERLNPKQRKSFLSQAKSLFDKSKTQNKRYKSEAIARGRQYGVTEKDIFGDYNEPLGQQDGQLSPEEQAELKQLLSDPTLR